MRYLLCIILPPIAVLTTGRLSAFLLNLILTAAFIVPGIIHAILITNKYYKDKDQEELMEMQEELFRFNRMNAQP